MPTTCWNSVPPKETNMLSMRNSSILRKLKGPQIQLRPHHFWTCASNLTTVVNSVLKFMINGTTSILKSYIFQTCAAICQPLLHMVLNILDIFLDFFIFIHFHYVKMHRL
jgi:hypothetical protein